MNSQKNIKELNIIISDTSAESGVLAGKKAAGFIREAIRDNGHANIILATGASQFNTLKSLISENVDWSKVVMFHLDEYIGLPESNPASFRKYLKERFISKVPNLKAAYLINGENDPEAECRRLDELISSHSIDVALVGIGENGHLAFNDPPADFENPKPYIIVELDEQCRKQQMGEGWFATLDDVPKKAISMSVKQILASKHIICSVPDRRKADAVKNSLTGPITNMVPGSILQQHPDCYFYLDKESASGIDNKTY